MIRGVVVAGTLAALAVGGWLLATIQYTDTARCWGDTWDYQAKAVNHARGHGFLVLGLLEPFGAYRFDEPREPFGGWLVADARRGGRRDLFRAPGYPAFLALVYVTGEVSPRRARRVQLTLMILAGALLPLLGAMLWGGRGALAGGLAGPTYLLGWAQWAEPLMPEPLTLFVQLLVVLGLASWQRRPGRRRALVVGLLCGASLLVRSSLIPIPPLILAWFALRRRWVDALLVLGGTAAAVLPWSAWSSHHAGRFVLVSTQVEKELIWSNTEVTLRTGEWGVAALEDPGSFYNQPEIRGRHHLVQVAAFYRAHWRSVPRMWMLKLRAAFSRRFGALKLFFGLLPVALLIGLLRAPRRRTVVVAAAVGAALVGFQHAVLPDAWPLLFYEPVLMPSVVLALALIAWLATGRRRPAWGPCLVAAIVLVESAWRNDPDALALCGLAGAIVLLAWRRRRMLRAFLELLPVPLLVPVLSIALAVLVAHGEKRYVVPCVPLFALLAWRLGIGIAEGLLLPNRSRVRYHEPQCPAGSP